MDICEAIDKLRDKKNIINDFDYKGDKSPSIFSMEKISENPSLYAKALSEGDKNLEAFLLKCYTNGVSTRACCAGHHYLSKPNKNSFVTFDNLDKNIYQIRAMVNRIYSIDGVQIRFGSILDKYNGLNTTNIAVFEFDKSQNQRLYPLMANAIDYSKSIGQYFVSQEIKKLYEICFYNKFKYMAPTASIIKGKNNEYTLKFFDALSYLSREYKNGLCFDVLLKEEYEERLLLNSFLLNNGFIKKGLVWTYVSQNNVDIMDKLNNIYDYANDDNLNDKIGVKELVLFQNELVSYYSDPNRNCIATYFDCDGETLTMTINIIDDIDDTKKLLYSKTVLYNQYYEQSFYKELVENIYNNYDQNDISISTDGDIIKITYAGNILSIKTSYLIESGYDKEHENLKKSR